MARDKRFFGYPPYGCPNDATYAAAASTGADAEGGQSSTAVTSGSQVTQATSQDVGVAPAYAPATARQPLSVAEASLLSIGEERAEGVGFDADSFVYVGPDDVESDEAREEREARAAGQASEGVEGTRQLPACSSQGVVVPQSSLELPAGPTRPAGASATFSAAAADRRALCEAELSEAAGEEEEEEEEEGKAEEREESVVGRASVHLVGLVGRDVQPTGDGSGPADLNAWSSLDTPTDFPRAPAGAAAAAAASAAAAGGYVAAHAGFGQEESFAACDPAMVVATPSAATAAPDGASLAAAAPETSAHAAAAAAAAESTAEKLCTEPVASGMTTGSARGGGLILFARDNVVVHPTGCANNLRVRGRLCIVDDGDSSLSLTWTPYASDTAPPLSPGDTVVGGAEEADEQQLWIRHAMRSVSLTDVRSIRRHTPALGWQYVIVILNSGMAYPPLYFYDGGVRHFLAELKRHVHLVRSCDDANVYMVSVPPDPLQKSLTTLHMQDVAAPFTELLSPLGGSPRASGSNTSHTAAALAGPHDTVPLSPSASFASESASASPAAAAMEGQLSQLMDGQWESAGLHSHVEKAAGGGAADGNMGAGSSGSRSGSNYAGRAEVSGRGWGRHRREMDKDPVEVVHNVSLQVLEKFSHVTRFARNVLSGGADRSLLGGAEADELMPCRGPPSPRRAQLTGCGSSSNGNSDADGSSNCVGSADVTAEADEGRLAEALAQAQVCGEGDERSILRSVPVLHEEWILLLDESGRVTDPGLLRQRIFEGGLQPELRREAWKYLLGYYPYESTFAERRELEEQKTLEYESYKLQWQSVTDTQAKRFAKYRERISRVDKDVVRTDCTRPFYAGDNNPNVVKLRNILITYSFYNFDLGYCQGMNELAGPVLEVVEDEVDAFWCFVGLMERMAPNFDRDQNGMHAQLLSVARLMVVVDPPLLEYLDSIDAANFFCCFRWILLLFKREFGHADVLRLWEALWSCPFTSHFHLYVTVAILVRMRGHIMGGQMDFDSLLEFVHGLSGRIDLQQTLLLAESLYVRAGEQGERCMPPPPPPALDIIEGPETGLADF